MNRAEQATRAAARMLGWDMTGFVWCEITFGLRRGEIPTGPYDPEPLTFAPLRDPGDAFLIESALHMGARYEFNGDMIAIYAHSTDPRFKDLGYMTSARADLVDDQLRARMLAVTTFASLCDLAENSHVEA